MLPVCCSQIQNISATKQQLVIAGCCHLGAFRAKFNDQIGAGHVVAYSVGHRPASHQQQLAGGRGKQEEKLKELSISNCHKEGYIGTSISNPPRFANPLSLTCLLCMTSQTGTSRALASLSSIHQDEQWSPATRRCFVDPFFRHARWSFPFGGQHSR